ncbi:unnamed protein product, partial [Owenia fusiformis]
MLGRYLTTCLTVGIVILSSFDMIQSGLLGNRAIKNLIKRRNRTSIKARTEAILTTGSVLPKSNERLALNNTVFEDDVSYAVEKPLDLPSCDHSDIFSTDPLRDECFYLRCDIASGKYVRRRCPSSMSVPSYYMQNKDGERSTREVTHLPCIMPSSKCRPSLVKQGVERPVVMAC